MKFLGLALLFTITLCQSRLSVDVYTESLCPDCMEFLLNSLTEAVDTPDIEEMVHIRVVPYGNVKRVYNQATGKWQFTCQHGAVECYGNYVQLCGQNILATKYPNDNEILQVQWAICIDRRIFKPYTNTRFDEAASLCAADFGISGTAVKECANGDQGYKLHLAAAEETDGLSPAHNYVPWITTNKRHIVTEEDLILEDLVAWACTNYQGPKIEACTTRSA
ncbi:unnamed protein product (macronuclear) [Paramecium tetraurelia]|uniref:Gamma-interferon-inducible lysosomal thiol reductase n=1 Tax=Paramecium tetraurelia TaxID=5888 RepID=A0CWW7_PARTE|nr:uncharacterized protein GSPATT00001487001 [Paramecium tetraurelia]CAK75284.1 unnamed protein product [Paramecium tetraurelia]|eukprot:XP_001442681.1 hypothetical protein (macronuclear) [Paramecium tetraurelia strain d4-2]